MTHSVTPIAFAMCLSLYMCYRSTGDQRERSRGAQTSVAPGGLPASDSFGFRAFSIACARCPRELDNFSQVKRLALCLLADLFAAAEAIRHDDGRVRRLTHSRQQAALTNGDGDIIFIALKPKRSRHTAAAGVQDLSVKAELL